MTMASPKHRVHDDEKRKQNLVMQSQLDVIVMVVPFPLQGHLNPLLQLSCQILSYNMPVHYVTSDVHIHQVTLRSVPKTSAIQFHSFPIPHFSTPPPDPRSPIKFPGHLQPSFEASRHLRKPVASLIHELSAKVKRLVIIHDPLMASVVQDAAFTLNAETYAFHSYSAFSLLYFHCIAQGNPWTSQFKLLTNMSPEDCFTQEFIGLVAKKDELIKERIGDLYNTFRSVEGAYVDHLAQEYYIGKKQWAISPLLPQENSQDSTSHNRCLQWLDKQEPKSVLYVSFGTTTTMEDEQIKELAIALEECEIKFIWILRDADRGDVLANEFGRGSVLPEGYEQRTEGRGIVESAWSPQLDILGHSSIGGFMTHCGWNSCLESIATGVPIAAWPMHSDQPANMALMIEVLKVGLLVREWSQREKTVRASTIKDTVKKLMASDEGNEIRKRAEELANVVKRSMAEGGTSRLEIESFIAHISR